MPKYNAGEAQLSIVPDATGFRAKLEADLKRIRAEYAVNVTANTAQAAADIRRFRDVEARNDMRLGVDVELAKAQADLAKFRAEQRADAITIPVDVDTAPLARARRDIERLGGGGGGIGSALGWNAGALGVASLPMLATGLASVTSAIQQLSQAGLALPGIFAGLGSSFGVLKLGTLGMKDAFKALGSGDVDKLNAALAGLAPNAQAFVKAIGDLKPAFKSLQSEVQNNLFAGMADQIKDLVNSDLPNLQTGLGGIATALNHDMAQLMGSLSSNSSKGLLDRILGNTADADERVKAAIDPIVHAFGSLTAAGTDALPRMADGLTKVSQRFDKFISDADKDGRLDKWINDGIDGLDHLGNTLINLGTSINAITKAFGGGDGLLGMLERGSKSLSDFLNSAHGQDTLKRIFQEGREELQKWMPIIHNLVPILESAYDGAKQWSDILLPALQGVTGVLKDFPGLVQAVVTAFLAWKTITGVTTLISSLGKLSTMLRVTLPADARTGAAGISAGLAMVVVPAIGKMLNDQLDQWLAQNHPAIDQANHTNTPGDLGKSARDWVNEHAPWIGKHLPNYHAPESSSAPAPAATPSAPFTPAWAGGGSPQNSPPLPGSTPIPGHAKGGPTRHGKGNGPTGGWISELHSDEWVLPAHARKAIGDRALWQLTQGRSYDGGGPGPRTDGTQPGPAPIAPNPTGGSIPDAISKAVGGASGAISHLQPTSGPGPGKSGGLPGGLPGGLGLGGGSGDPDAVHKWFPWLKSFEKNGVSGVLENMPDKIKPKNIAYQFGQTLLSGVLGGLGLDKSILSPNNPYNKAIQQTAGFYAKKFGGGSDDSSGGGAASMSDAAVVSKLSGMGFTPDQIKSVIGKRDETAQKNALMQQLSAAGLSSSDIQAAMGALGGKGKAPAANYAGGSDSIHNTVYKAFKAAGFPDAEWPDLVQIINHESGWNPRAQNPSSTAYGLGQFLDTTWATVGGKKTSSAAKQAAYMMDYIKGRYGDPAKAWAFWQAHHSYDVGGPTPGSPSTPFPAILHGNEFVQRASAVNKYGVPFMKALNDGRIDPKVLPQFYVGSPGPFGQFLLPEPPTPQPNQSQPGPSNAGTIMGSAPIKAPQQPTKAKALQPPQPATGPPKTSGPAPPPAPKHAPKPAPKPKTPEEPQQPTQSKPKLPSFPAAQVAPAPKSLDHELPALKKGISSGAGAIAGIVSQAISAAAAAGSFGAAGAAGGKAGGLAAGLIKEGGKIVNAAINVPSSFLVGNITPGTQDSAYGSTLAPKQNVPDTASIGRVQNNKFYGMDVDKVFQELDKRDAQAHQAALASYR